MSQNSYNLRSFNCNLRPIEEVRESHAEMDSQSRHSNKQMRLFKSISNFPLQTKKARKSDESH